MKGFAVSVVSPPAAPPPSLTAEELVTYLAPKLNAARDLRAKIFGCSDPRLALCAPQVNDRQRRNMALASLRSALPLARLQQGHLATGEPRVLVGPILASSHPPPPLLSVSRQSRRRRAALALYAATLISARIGTPTLLWTAANLVFALPAALKAGALPKVCTAPWVSVQLGYRLDPLLCLSPRLDPRPGDSVFRAFAGGPRCREQSGGSDGAPEGG